MIVNLKKIEKEFKKFSKLDNSDLLISMMLKKLGLELQNQYSKKELIETKLESPELLKSVALPKSLKNIVLDKKNENEDFSYTGCLYDDLSNKDKLSNKMFFECKDNFKNKNIVCRREEDLDFVLNQLIKKENLNELMAHNEICREFNEIKYNISLEMLNKEEKELLLDISDNYDFYYNHPDVGYDKIKNEINLVLKNHFKGFYFYYPKNKDLFYTFSIKKEG